jgi:L-threonylcarbamoyladenylate synthase
MEKLDLHSFVRLDINKLKGKIFCFPTDTVYGVGCLYNDLNAINKIYEMKNRDSKKPLVNLISRLSQIRELGIEISHFQKNIMLEAWPGALSVILAYGDNSISFRFPNSILVQRICDKFGLIPTTSVNESGDKELNNYEDIKKAFGDKIDYFIYDMDSKLSNLASTVVDLRGDVVKVLRQGSFKI